MKDHMIVPIYSMNGILFNTNGVSYMRFHLTLFTFILGNHERTNEDVLPISGD